jgi:galactokinase
MTSNSWISSFFIKEFQVEPRCFRSPGRINLIGEHTDYNEGFVLPAGIDKFCSIAIAPSGSDFTTLIATDLDEHCITNHFPEEKHANSWSNYVFGVIAAFQRRGKNIPHFNAVVKSDVPVGAGLSSSAALESVFAFAFNELFQCGFDRLELTRIAKEAENDFIGLQCGIMDMFASIHAKLDHVIRLDCRSLDFEYVPMKLGNNKIVLFDTCVKHELASSEYNTRRLECISVVDKLNKTGENFPSLRNVSMEMLEKNRNLFSENEYKRARYVIGENVRLLDFCDAIENEDWRKAGSLLMEAHEGLQNDYEVSCTELDFLVETAKELNGIWGARMMGGGFGGCTLNLVAEEKVNEVVQTISEAYKNQFGIDLKHYIAGTSNGAAEF